VRRLELPTSTSRTWRANQLCYTPKILKNPIFRPWRPRRHALIPIPDFGIEDPRSASGTGPTVLHPVLPSEASAKEGCRSVALAKVYLFKCTKIINYSVSTKKPPPCNPPTLNLRWTKPETSNFIFLCSSNTEPIPLPCPCSFLVPDPS
jgi:hypothetical protein